MAKSNKNPTIGKNKFRSICLLAILFCILIYFKLNNMFLNGSNGDHFMEGYFVNTTGCHMLALNPFSKTALSYLSHEEPMKCTKVKLLDVKTIKGENYLVLSMSKEEILKTCNVERVSEVYCEYRIIKRHDDNVNKYSDIGIFQLRDKLRQIKLKSGSVIIRVQCFGENNKSVYHDVLFLLPVVPDNSSRSSRHKHLSVMIIGIDSISHMQFLRTMPLLRAYIESLPHVEFWGYNRVGRNTYPNLMPLFSGLNETELEADCYDGELNYDKCDLIWQDFKKAGYNTSYAEDNSVIGNFNYGKWGFNQTPTDFYLRPVMLEIDKYTRYSIDEQENIHCSASRKYADILHEFIYKMIPHLKHGPHFSIFWETQGVHDYFNYPKFLDKHYLKLLKRLRSNHILSNTLVLLMSDHGIRFGSFRSTYQGMLEESQPMLIAIYPKWLEEAYPTALFNLRKNARSLVTTFDLHATLKDLTNIKLLEDIHIENRTRLLQELGPNIPRGISLFLPIPEIRDCNSASIPDSFCLCHKLHQISASDNRSKRAARFMVDYINKLIKNYPLCRSLELKDVQDAYLLDRNNDEQVFSVKVRFKTLPGEAIFEGTTTFSGHFLALNGPIIRINRYGNQSNCVRNYRIEMYCCCKK